MTDEIVRPRPLAQVTPRLEPRAGRHGLARLGRPSLYIAVTVWMTATLGPYVIMLLTSLSPQSQLIAPGGSLLPTHPTLAAYRELFDKTPFVSYLTNSVITALCTVAFSLLIAVAAAISLSRFRFRGRSAVLTGLLVAQLFPAVLLVIPLQVELRTMSLLDSRWGLLLVYTTFATPFATFLLKGFLDGLPRELDEAATIDGCSPMQMVRHILLPLMRPGLTAAGTYIFIFAWNEFLYALTFTQTTAAQTIPVGLSMFIGEYQIRWDLLTAGGVLAAVPVLVGFMLVQKQLVSGLTAGAVKG
ncbi:carbohydrate ABC transporter permease [Cellulomonas sp. WB94]|uniref:carbohydrate ABC transporter permease n=1 Tax=Cellulomonas sp. WB94 TaxID=2173174 RepID=UPI000D5677C7|nr:carbohydrate ABC transporter permease [Cellulomonas sp. WB94]PVU81991.1 carbohydrate ABC transporter permease [Cellulomonas sp. WB94]